jgi:hypothetical protein
MRIERHFTVAGQDAYAGLEWKTTTSEIRNPDGSVVFRLDNLEVPTTWSQVAADVLAQKYFRRAGVPVALKAVEESGIRRSRFPVAPPGRHRSARRAAREGSLHAGDQRQGGLRSPRWHLGLLGLEGRLFRQRRRCQRLLR